MDAKYTANPVMFRNNPLGFILAVILIAAFGLGILILLWWYLVCKSTKLSVFENEVLFEKGLLSKERSEVNISSIRTIRVRQSFFNPEFVAAGLPDPNRVRELIKQKQGSA